MDMKNTVAFLFAGGEGKRLGAITYSKPKPLVPFAGKYRLIDFSLSNAANSGVRQLGVLVQTHQTSIIDYIENGNPWGFRYPKSELRVLPPRTDNGNAAVYLGSADAIRKNLDFLNNDIDCDTVLVLSADHVYNMDYADLVSFHRWKNADVTIAITKEKRKDAHYFGIVLQDNSDRILEWQEKPSNAKNTFASIGIYVFSKKFLVNALETCEDIDFGCYVIPCAIRQARIYGYQFNNYWSDVGTPNAYWRTSLDLLGQQHKIDLDKWRIRSNHYKYTQDEFINQKYVESSVVIENSIISENSLVKGKVFNSIIFPGVMIDSGAYVSNSIVMTNCTVASNSLIENTILCDRVYVSCGTLIGYTDCSSSPFEDADLMENGLVVIGPDVSLRARECIHKASMIFSQMDYVQRNYPCNRIE